MHMLRALVVACAALIMALPVFPAAAQEVSASFPQGSVLVGNDTATCNSARDGALRYNSSTDTWNFCSGTGWTAFGGGATTPGGSDTHVQFNDGSTMGGDAGMVYNKTTDVLSVSGAVALGAVAGAAAPVTAPASVSAQVFTTPGSAGWTRPAGITKIKVTVVGGGGGGGGADSTAAAAYTTAGGGGSGGTAIEWIDVSSIAFASVTVGSAGGGGAIAGGTGTGGGTSCLSTLTACGGTVYLQATGGGAGGGTGSAAVANVSGNGGTAGAGSSGNINLNGGVGQKGFVLSGQTMAVGGAGAASSMSQVTFGPTLFNSSAQTAGVAGNNYGSGGSGAVSANTTGAVGGNGTAGIVIIEEF